MAGELTQLDTVQADPQLVQRSKIGEENPDLMMPQPTLAPPKVIAVVQHEPVRRTARPKPSSSSKAKPVADPFADNSIPFQSAEDYTPGIEHEKTESAALKQESVEEAVQPVSETPGETPDKTPVEQAMQEDASPVSVTEPGFN